MRIKFLYIILLNLRSFILRDFRTFSIVFISLAITVSCSIYLTNLSIFQLEEFQKQYDKKMKYVNIQINDQNLSDSKILIDTILKNDYLPSIQYISVMSEMNQNERKMNVFGIKGNDETFEILEGDMIQTPINKEIEDQKIIISSSLLDYKQQLTFINNKYVIENQPFQILGVISNKYDSIYMPFNTFISKGYSINKIKLLLSESLTSSQFNRLIQDMNNINPSYFVVPLPKYNEEAIKIILFFGLGVMLLYAFVMVNVISLFKYWLSENKEIYFIYGLCGASDITRYTIILLQCLGIGVITYVSGFLLFILIKNTINNFVPYIEVPVTLIITIFLVYLGIIFVSIHSIARKISVSTIMTRKN